MKAELGRVWDNPKDFWRAEVRLDNRVLATCESMISEAEARKKAEKIIAAFNCKRVLADALKFQDSNAPYSRKLEAVYSALKTIGEDGYTTEQADACDPHTATQARLAALEEALRIIDRHMTGDMNYEHSVLSGEDPASPDCKTPAGVVRTALAKS